MIDAAEMWQLEAERLRAENARLRVIAHEMVNTCMDAASMIGERDDHPSSAADDKYARDMLDDCNRWKLELHSPTSAGTETSVGRRPDGSGTHPSRGEPTATPKAKAEDPPKWCGDCSDRVAPHWFKLVTVRGRWKTVQSFRPPEDHKQSPEEWRKCPGPARKEGK